MTTITETGHRLNHVEMVYRPGERALAGRVFELLGMRVLDRGGTWMTALVDPDVADFSNNACYASEVTPEQWALGADARTRDRRTTTTTTVGDRRARLPRPPAHRAATLVPLRHPVPLDRDDFDATLDRVRAADDDPELAGRVALSACSTPTNRARPRPT